MFLASWDAKYCVSTWDITDPFIHNANTYS